MNAESQLEKDVRREIYDVTMREGAPPTVSRVAAALSISREDAAGAFASLAERHMIVLQPDGGEVLMAGPFSAVPTPFRVTIGDISAYGNCIWDALGIVAMLQRDAHVDTSCADCGVATRIDVVGNALGAASGFMHFALPPRDWWNDIVFT